MHLIRAAHRALRPAGALVAIGALIDDAPRENSSSSWTRPPRSTC